MGLDIEAVEKEKPESSKKTGKPKGKLGYERARERNYTIKEQKMCLKLQEEWVEREIDLIKQGNENKEPLRKDKGKNWGWFDGLAKWG